MAVQRWVIKSARKDKAGNDQFVHWPDNTQIGLTNDVTRACFFQTSGEAFKYIELIKVGTWKRVYTLDDYTYHILRFVLF